MLETAPKYPEDIFLVNLTKFYVFIVFNAIIKPNEFRYRRTVKSHFINLLRESASLLIRFV